MKRGTVNANRVIIMTLRLGSLFSIIFMIAGMTMFLLSGDSTEQVYQSLGLQQILVGLMTFDSVSLMTAGILILLMTPLLRVLGAGLSFLLLEKDPAYALISLGVLTILIFSLLVPQL